MEIKILEQKDNKLLKRKEILLLIDHSNRATPSREELSNEISKIFNVPKEKIVIDYILSIRGDQKAKAKVKIYEA
jgi:small subunit ribosomal protein S24e